MNSPVTDEPAERYGSLVLGMLSPLRRVDVTATQAEIAYHDIAETAWNDLLEDYPAAGYDGDAFSPVVLVAALNDILGRPVPTAKEEVVPADVVTCLVQWLEGTCGELQAIDPQAIEIACLLTEGFSHRAISEGLDIGLRLVNRIVEDIRCSSVAESEAKESISAVSQDREVAPC